MIYNPLDKEYKNITGASRHGDELRFRVKGNFNSVLFVYYKDGQSINKISMSKKEDYFEVSLILDVGLYFYSFLVDNISYISCGNKLFGQLNNSPVFYQHTVYDKDYSTPQWLKGGIIYQIFPDRFYVGKDENISSSDRFIHKNLLDTPIFSKDEDGKVKNCDFFGGNLSGIIEKLPYLKDLNVSCIYLNPIFKAYSNHRYDTGNYLEIDPLLGDMNKFIELISEANKFGIKIILDGVFNHTGDDSLYFNKYNNYESIGAFNSESSPYVDWFNFINYPNEYFSWWGIETLPSTNKSENSKYIEFITGKDGVIDFYTSLNIGGWRLDVVDELPSHFVKKIRKATKEVNPNAIIIGEVWEDATNKISYSERREYFQGKELDSIMNYPLKNAIIDFVTEKNFHNLSNVILTEIDHFPKQSLDNLMNILSTHDTYRILSSLGEIDASSLSKEQQANIILKDEQLIKAKLRLKIASLLQYTLIGVPCIYYGDEVGMQGYSDPLNRKFFPWGNEDDDILNWYKKLGNIRKEYSCFINGEYQEIYSNNGKFIFERFNSESSVLIALNLSESNLEFTFDGRLTDVVCERVIENKVTLKKFEFGIFVNE